MIDLNSVSNLMQDDIDSVTAWCDNLYITNFAEYFKDQRELYIKLKSKKHLVTDEELEIILTNTPLELFSVAEKLSQLKISQEVIRMKNKQKAANLVEASSETTQTKKKEEADLLMLEDKLVDVIYSAIISRVDKEIAFSRELIMSAKKIWDRRRQTENVNPISPMDTSSSNVDTEHKTFYEQQLESATKHKQRVY